MDLSNPHFIDGQATWQILTWVFPISAVSLFKFNKLPQADHIQLAHCETGTKNIFETFHF